MIMRICALVLLFSVVLSVSASELRQVEQAIEGSYIVVLKSNDNDLRRDTAGKEDAADYVSRAALELASAHDLQVDQVYEHALQGFAVKGTEESIKALLSDPRIDYVEQDAMSYLSATQSNAPWALDRIDQRGRTLNGSYVYNVTASNVRVYVIDSGIRASHSQFGGRVLAGVTAINDGRGSNDCNGHGTHVAGSIGGSTYGVAKSVRLVPVRVFGCTGGSANSTIIAGIDWVAANRVLPAVANMSLGGPASSAIDSATNNLNNRGVTVVVAAGNENQNACNVSPARVANAMTVGATSSGDARASFSNYGSCVNIMAPGQSIQSAWHTSNTATNTLNGTSMAAPHVAGVVALWLTNNPNASPAALRSHIYGRATTGALTNLNGSPNRLLYSR